MNDRPRVADLIAAAGERLSRARELLLQPTPGNVDAASRQFLQAAERLETTCRSLGADEKLDAAVIRSLETLRVDLVAAKRLLDHAALHHSGVLRAMLEANSASQPATACSVHLEA